MNKRTLYAASISIAAMSAVAVTVPAFAQSTSSTSTVRTTETEPKTVTIPVDTVVRGEAGKIYPLEKWDVVNGEYTVTVKAVNQKSEHPNSDIIVRSQKSQLTVEDVENEAFVEKTANGSLIVEDGQVHVYVKLGKDKVFSGGVEVVLTPVVAPAPEVPKEETPPVEESAPEAPAPEQEEAPVEIPKTGFTAVLGGLLGTSALGLSIHSWLSSRSAVRRSIR